jgi:hypothetical protein
MVDSTPAECLRLKDRWGVTPVHATLFAAIPSAELMSLLLQRKPAVALDDFDGQSLLLRVCASSVHDVELLRAVCAARPAALQIRDSRAQLPLHTGPGADVATAARAGGQSAGDGGHDSVAGARAPVRRARAQPPPPHRAGRWVWAFRDANCHAADIVAALVDHAPFWKELRAAESIGGHGHSHGRTTQTGPQADWSALSTLQQPAHRVLQAWPALATA